MRNATLVWYQRTVTLACANSETLDTKRLWLTLVSDYKGQFSPVDRSALVSAVASYSFTFFQKQVISRVLMHQPSPGNIVFSLRASHDLEMGCSTLLTLLVDLLVSFKQALFLPTPVSISIAATDYQHRYMQCRCSYITYYVTKPLAAVVNHVTPY